MPDIKYFLLARKRALEARGIKYKIGKVAIPGYPIAAEKTYAKNLREMVAYMNRLIEQRLFPELPRIISQARAERMDAYADTLTEIVDTVKAEFGEKYTEAEIRRLASDEANEVSNFNRNQLTRIISNAVGTDVFLTEPYLQSTLDSFVKDNVDLITSIPRDQFTEIESTVKRAIRSGQSVKDTEKLIKERWSDALKDKPKNRAELIARDQNGKLYGELNQLRQTEFGIDEYIWRGVLDARERETHRAHEGKKYSWKKPPSNTGHPGWDYQCRCVAQPVIDLEGIEKTAAAIEAEKPPAPVRAAKKAVSAFANMEIEKPLQKSIQVGIDSIEQVYTPKQLEFVKMPIRGSQGKVTAGALRMQYVKTGESLLDRELRPYSISISRKGTHQASSLAHEFGHLFDYTAGKKFAGKYMQIAKRGRPEFTEFWKAVDESKAFKELSFRNWRDIQQKPELARLPYPGQPISTKYRLYLLEESEIWARAFAQYVATESKSAVMLQEIEGLRKLNHIHMQWSAEDFEPIRKAIKRIIDELG